MDRAIAVWEGEGGAHKPVGSKVPQSPRQHPTLWFGVLYVITIVAVLAFVATLNSGRRKEQGQAAQPMTRPGGLEKGVHRE